MRVFSKKLYMIISLMVLFIFSGCNNNTSDATTLVIENARIEYPSSLNAGDNIELKYSLNSSDNNQNVTVTYSLISKSANKTIEENSDTTITTIVPDLEYHLGGTVVNLEGGTNLFDENLTLPIDINEGEYLLSIHVDNARSSKSIIYPDGDLFIDEEDIYNITNNNIFPDIVVENFTLDDDVLLLSDNNLDSTFSSTLSISSKYYDVNNTTLNVCLEINGDCKELNILSKENIFKNQVNIDNIKSYVTHIALELQIPPQTREEILNEIGDSVVSAKVIVKANQDNLLLESTNEDNNNFSTTLSLYNANQLVLNNSDNELISFEKNYKLNKMKKRFGALLNVESKAAIELEKSYAYANGDLTLRILSHDINFLYIGVEAKFQYNSFEDTGVERTFKFLGKTIQEFKDYRDNLKTGISDFKDIKNGIKSIPENWNTTLEDIKNVKLVEIAADATEETIKQINSINQKKINSIIKSTLSVAKEFSLTETKKYEEEFLLGIVPVTVSAGAGGEFGLRPDISITGITGFEASLTPFGKIGGFATGGVGVPGFSAGVEADLTFIDNEFEATTGFQLTLDGDETSLYLDGTASQLIQNTITGPNGNIDLYAEYTLPKTCVRKIRYCSSYNLNLSCKKHKTKHVHYPCGIETHKPTKNIFSWKSFELNNELLNKNEQLLRKKLY